MKKVAWYWIYLFVLGLLIVLYKSHFQNAFHFDDSHAIVDNAYIQDLGNISSFFTDAKTFSSLPTNVTYRPILTTSFALDYYLGEGLNLVQFHLTSFTLFLLQVFFMFLLFKKLYQKNNNENIAGLVTLCSVSFYAFNTSLAETINYIVARGDIFSGLGTVAALLMYVSKGRFKKWYLYLIPGIIAILAKSLAFVFLLIIVVYSLLFEEETWKERMRHFLISVVLVGLVLGVVKYFDPVMINTVEGYPFWYRLTQPYIILIYFKNFFLPIHLSADTDYFAFNSFFDGRLYLGLFFCILILATAFVTLKKKETRLISFGLFWFLIALFPTSFMPLNEVMNDHRVYFPYIGLSLSLGGGMLWLLKASAGYAKKVQLERLLVGVFLIVIVGHAFGVTVRNAVWRSEKSLWKDVVEKSPLNARGYVNYSQALMDEGLIDEVDWLLERALVLAPQYPYAYMAMARLNEIRGNFAESERWYKAALQMNTYKPNTQTQYGLFLIRRKRYEDAIKVMEDNLIMAPSDFTLKNGLLFLYFQTGQIKKMIDMLHVLDQMHYSNPDLPLYKMIINEFSTQRTPEMYFALGDRFEQSGYWAFAARSNERALDLGGDKKRGYVNLCRIYGILNDVERIKSFCFGVKKRSL